MALKSYGGYVWTAQEPVPESTGSEHFGIALGLLGGAGGLAYLGTRELNNGYRGIDYLASSARLVGHLSPFQIASTFRVPEILSPYLSNRYRFPGTTTVEWDRSLLESRSSFDWLKQVTNLDERELSQRGVTPGMLGPNTARQLRWIPNTSTSGRLESVLASGQSHVLATDISLVARNEEILNGLTERRGINRYLAGIFAAEDMYKHASFAENEVFSAKDGFKQKSSTFIPVPSIQGPVRSLKDLHRRSTLARGVSAFEMGRFNQLLENVSEQFLGEKGKILFKKGLNLGPGVRPGPASAMFMRYGGLAGAVGGGLILNSHLDWLRREGPIGSLIASGIVGGGLSYLASKLGASSKQAALLGLGATGAQMMLPGFDQGIFAGIATAGINLDILRGSSINPVNYYRRTLEGFFPGVSDWQTGALLGLGAITASAVRLPGMSERLNTKLIRDPRIRSMIGIPDDMLSDIVDINKSTRDMFFEQLAQSSGIESGQSKGVIQRARLIRNYYQGDNFIEATRRLNLLWDTADETVRESRIRNPIHNFAFRRLESIAQRQTNSGFDLVRKEVAGHMTHALMSFLGADTTITKELQQQVRALNFKTPVGRFGKLATVGLTVLAAHQIVTGGLLGSMETAEELEDIYAGRKLVEIKKGRFWEGGSTPFEGGETLYYRPHAYALMMNRVREKGIWGEQEDRRSPIGKFLTKNFTYDLEKENYYSRPYPMTSPAFADVPIIGPLLGSTIGSVLKPLKTMHTSEWIRNVGDQTQYANVYRGDFIEPAYNLGAVGTGKPISPYNAVALNATITNQFRELEGLTGWSKNVFSNLTFGSETWGQEQARIATSSEMTSWNNRFWEAQLGGGLFSNEFLRRILPKKESDIKSFNPIKNNMPSWLPDKWHYGDPYRLVEWGEARLPGAGFSALHPELQGLSPEEYPLIYRYQILADVAPLTPEFFQTQARLYKMRQQGALTPEQIKYIDRLDEQRARVVNKYTFAEVDPNAIRLPGSSLIRNTFLGAMEGIRHIAAPAEYLIPPPLALRPFQKLTGQFRDPIEQYEAERLYGTRMSFWDEPIRDWLRPSFWSAAHLLGYDGKPIWKAKADQTNESFDKLEFIKYMKLAEEAEKEGLSKEAAKYRWQASQTRHGVNPQGSVLSIYWTLPNEDRPFFNAFLEASNTSDRKRILEMVPTDQKHLYETLWSRMDQGDPTLYNTHSVVSKEFLNQRLAALNQEGMVIPPEDWIGWNQNVDMSDIEARYVDRLGGDLHDYGLWESDLRKSEAQPFLENSEVPLARLSFTNIRSEIHNMLGSSFNPGFTTYNALPGTNPTLHVYYNDNRDNELANALERHINGY